MSYKRYRGECISLFSTEAVEGKTPKRICITKSYIRPTRISLTRIGLQTRVVWHTGKVLACGAEGPRFNPQQDQGVL